MILSVVLREIVFLFILLKLSCIFGWETQLLLVSILTIAYSFSYFLNCINIERYIMKINFLFCILNILGIVTNCGDTNIKQC